MKLVALLTEIKIVRNKIDVYGANELGGLGLNINNATAKLIGDTGVPKYRFNWTYIAKVYTFSCYLLPNGKFLLRNTGEIRFWLNSLNVPFEIEENMAYLLINSNFFNIIDK